MPKDGEQVTVRAVWPMPDAPAGAGVTVSWGPHLAALVDAGRYEVLPDATALPAAPAGDAPPGGIAPAAVGPAAGDGAGDGGQPPRRGRGR